MSGAGVVTWFNHRRGIGFIKPDDEGVDIFVHQSLIHMTGYRNLSPGDRVEFQAESAIINGSRRAVRVTGPGGKQLIGAQRCRDRHTAKKIQERMTSEAENRSKPRTLVIDPTTAPSPINLVPEVEQLQRKLQRQPQVSRASVEFLLIVDGPICDRSEGASSWTEFDRAYRKRRDAVARCITAALVGEGQSAGVCWLYFEQQEVLVRLSSAFLQHPHACGGVTNEHTILSKLDLVLGAASTEFDIRVPAQNGTSPGTAAAATAAAAAAAGADEEVEVEDQKQQAIEESDKSGSGRRFELPVSFGCECQCSCCGCAGGVPNVPGAQVLFRFKNKEHLSLYVIARMLSARAEEEGVVRKPASKAKECDSRLVVAELHDSAEVFLPVYDIQNDNAERTEQCAEEVQEACPSVLLVMGCVLDHLMTTAAVMATATSCGLPVCRVNLGPEAEFTSNIIHVVRAHHEARVFVPAILALLNEEKETEGKNKKNGSLERSSSVARPNDDDVNDSADSSSNRSNWFCTCALHFWLWFPHLEPADLSEIGLGILDMHPVQHTPTSSSHADVSATAHLHAAAAEAEVASARARARTCVLPQLVVASLAKSHGAYEHNRLSLTLGSGSGESHACDGDGDRTDGAQVTLTAGCSLLQVYLPRRGWGACTEHHISVALLDSMRCEKHSSFFEKRLGGAGAGADGTFSRALKFWGLNVAIKSVLGKAKRENVGRRKAEKKSVVGESHEPKKRQEQKKPHAPITAATLSAVCLVVIIDPDSAALTPALPLYNHSHSEMTPEEANEACSDKANGRAKRDQPPMPRLHVMFASPDDGITAALIRASLPAQLPVVTCTLPDLYNTSSGSKLSSQSLIRAIASLRGHNNCGMLWPAARRLRPGTNTGII